MRINGHGHILPEPSQIPKFMKDKKLFWIDEDKKFMRQGDWSRPISDPSFFIKEKIEWMHQYQIDHSVMLCLSQLYCNGWDEQDCFDVIRFQNDFIDSRVFPESLQLAWLFSYMPLYSVCIEPFSLLSSSVAGIGKDKLFITVQQVTGLIKVVLISGCCRQAMG